MLKVRFDQINAFSATGQGMASGKPRVDVIHLAGAPTPTLRGRNGPLMGADAKGRVVTLGDVGGPTGAPCTCMRLKDMRFYASLLGAWRNMS